MAQWLCCQIFKDLLSHSFLTLGLNTTSITPSPSCVHTSKILCGLYDCIRLYKTEVAITPITFRGTQCQETHFPLVWDSGTHKARAYKYI